MSRVCVCVMEVSCDQNVVATKRPASQACQLSVVQWEQGPWSPHPPKSEQQVRGPVKGNCPNALLRTWVFRRSHVAPFLLLFLEKPFCSVQVYHPVLHLCVSYVNIMEILFILFRFRGVTLGPWHGLTVYQLCPFLQELTDARQLPLDNY